MNLKERRLKERTDPTYALIKCNYDTIYFLAAQIDIKNKLLNETFKVNNIQKQVINSQEELINLTKENKEEIQKGYAALADKAINIADTTLKIPSRF